MQTSNIEWCDATWNVVRGCSRVSRGCMNCYAERMARRFQAPGMPYHGLIAKGGQWNGRVRLVESKLREPLSWKKHAKIFVNSMSDLFHTAVPMEFIDKVFAVMAACPWHIFQILTKHPTRMALYLNTHGRVGMIRRAAVEMGLDEALPWLELMQVNRYLANVWLGVSAEDQAAANYRIWQLSLLPAAVRWLSAEPLLGPIDFGTPENSNHLLTGKPLGKARARAPLDWVVVGGESGPGARPMHPYWVCDLRDQCQAANVPFFFKQWGDWVPRSGRLTCGDENFEILDPQCKRWPDVVRLGEHGRDTRISENCTPDMGEDVFVQRVGKKRAGRSLDGTTWLQFPNAPAPF